jgi:hypothetical protein
MKTIISLMLLVGGILLIIFGIQASESLGSDISRFFSGAPTDKAIWMLIGGTVVTIAGLSGFTLRSK